MQSDREVIKVSAKIMTADQVAAEVLDGAHLTFPGNASILVADALLEALERRYLETQHPKGITVFEPCNASIGDAGGIQRFTHRGFVKRLIASALPSRATELARMIREGDIEAYCFPMGVLYSLARESGAGRPGLLSEVGMGTFVDPKFGGGKLNKKTTEDLVSRVNIHNKEWIFYHAVHVDVAFLKGTTADQVGNVTMENEPLTLGVLTLAIATKARGGKVFVQVERLAAEGSLDPKQVMIPGCLIDGIVIVPDALQSGASRHDPSITGQLKVEVPRRPLPGLTDRIILARAAASLQQGWLVNLGVGVGNRLPQILHEAGCLDRVTFSTEHGAFGGLPTEPPTFGAHINPASLFDPTDTFNLYTGGLLDATFLGMAQVDEAGNVNVSQFGDRVMGPGGFMDITVRTPRIYICGEFTAKGLEASVSDGRVNIGVEGKVKKLVKKVDQITLNGRLALERGQTITLITERGLFTFTESGWKLCEVAPGINIERDIAPAMEFPLQVSAQLGLYPKEALLPAGEAFSKWLSGLKTQSQKASRYHADRFEGAAS